MTVEDEMEKLSLIYAVCDVSSSTSVYAERCESVVVNCIGLGFIIIINVK